MAYLSEADLTTHIYSEIITEITRADATLAPKAISAAIAEAGSYLSKYDLTKLFADSFADENLKNKVKDIACWMLVKLSNPNIDLSLFRTAYEDAIKYFDKVIVGKIDPDGWPYKPDPAPVYPTDPITGLPYDPSTGLPVDPTTRLTGGGTVSSQSNYKRQNHY